MVMVWQCQSPAQCRSLSVDLAPIAGPLPFGDANPPAGDNHPLASPGVGAYSRSANRVGRPRISAELRKHRAHDEFGGFDEINGTVGKPIRQSHLGMPLPVEIG